MGNCLVTKLKGVVDNDELPKYGTIRFKIHAKDKVITPYNAYNFYLQKGTLTCVNGKTFHSINITTGEVLESNLTTKTFEDWLNVGLAAAEDYVFEFTPKYNVKALGFNGNIADYVEINADDFNFSPVLYEFSIISQSWNHLVKGHFSPMNPSIFTIVCFIRTDIDINISEFSGASALKNLSAAGPNSHGNIEDLANCLQLGKMEVWGNNDVSGDALNLFSAMVSAGRTSGTLLIGAAHSKVTVDGIPFDQALPEAAWAIKATFDPSVQGGYSYVYV